MNDEPTLRQIQQRIRDLDSQRAQLQEERAQAIIQAKRVGMNNREVARALGIHESHVYRLQTTGAKQ